MTVTGKIRDYYNRLRQGLSTGTVATSIGGARQSIREIASGATGGRISPTDNSVNPNIRNNNGFTSIMYPDGGGANGGGGSNAGWANEEQNAENRERQQAEVKRLAEQERARQEQIRLDELAKKNALEKALKQQAEERARQEKIIQEQQRQQQLALIQQKIQEQQRQTGNFLTNKEQQALAIAQQVKQSGTPISEFEFRRKLNESGAGTKALRTATMKEQQYGKQTGVSLQQLREQSKADFYDKMGQGYSGTPNKKVTQTTKPVVIIKRTGDPIKDFFKYDAPAFVKDVGEKLKVKQFSQGFGAFSKDVKEKLMLDKFAEKTLPAIEKADTKIRSLTMPQTSGEKVVEAMQKDYDTKLEAHNIKVEKFNAEGGTQEEQAQLQSESFYLLNYAKGIETYSKGVQRAKESSADVFARGVVTGIATFPTQTASFGIGLITSPVKTTYETGKGIVGIPKRLVESPSSFGGELLGNVATGVAAGSLWSGAKTPYIKKLSKPTPYEIGVVKQIGQKAIVRGKQVTPARYGIRTTPIEEFFGDILGEESGVRVPITKETIVSQRGIAQVKDRVSIGKFSVRKQGSNVIDQYLQISSSDTGLKWSDLTKVEKDFIKQAAGKESIKVINEAQLSNKVLSKGIAIKSPERINLITGEVVKVQPKIIYSQSLSQLYPMKKGTFALSKTGVMRARQPQTQGIQFIFKGKEGKLALPEGVEIYKAPLEATIKPERPTTKITSPEAQSFMQKIVKQVEIEAPEQTGVFNIPRKTTIKIIKEMPLENSISSRVTMTRPTQIGKQKQITSQRLIPPEGTQKRSIEKEKEELTPSIISKNITSFGISLEQEQEQRLAQTPSMDLKQRMKQQEELKTISPVPINTSSFFFPGETIPTREIIVPPFERKKRKGQRQQAYDTFALVESATKGKRARWIQVGDNLPYGSALSAGARFTDQSSLSSQFKVVKDEGKVNQVKDNFWGDVAFKFRDFMVRKGTKLQQQNRFIERAKYRLDSPQERGQIKRARFFRL